MCGALLSIIAVIGIFLAGGKGLWAATHRNHPPTVTIHMANFADAVNDLSSPSVTIRQQGIKDLETLDLYEAPQTQQREVFDKISAFVQLRYPAPAGDPFSSCANSVDPPAADLRDVLALVGERPPSDDIFVDLSKINLASASLQFLNMNAVSFDGTLLCRADLNRSTYTDASFDGAYIWGAFLDLAVVGPEQLKKAKTLCGTKVSITIAGATELKTLFTEDPNGRQPCRFWVH